MTVGADREAALAQAREGCVLADRSELGRLLATGPDFLDLLHRLSTASVAGLNEGEGRPTVLTTPKGRIVERLFVHHLGPAGVLSVGDRTSCRPYIPSLGNKAPSPQSAVTSAVTTCPLFTSGPWHAVC